MEYNLKDKCKQCRRRNYINNDKHCAKCQSVLDTLKHTIALPVSRKFALKVIAGCREWRIHEKGDFYRSRIFSGHPEKKYIKLHPVGQRRFFAVALELENLVLHGPDGPSQDPCPLTKLEVKAGAVIGSAGLYPNEVNKAKREYELELEIEQEQEQEAIFVNKSDDI